MRWKNDSLSSRKFFKIVTSGYVKSSFLRHFRLPFSYIFPHPEFLYTRVDVLLLFEFLFQVSMCYGKKCPVHALYCMINPHWYCNLLYHSNGFFNHWPHNRNYSNPSSEKINWNIREWTFTISWIYSFDSREYCQREMLGFFSDWDSNSLN